MAGTDCSGTENGLYLGLSKNFSGKHKGLVGEEQEMRLDQQKDHTKEVLHTKNIRRRKSQRAESSSLTHFYLATNNFFKMSVWEDYLFGGWSRLRCIRRQMLPLPKPKCFCEY